MTFRAINTRLIPGLYFTIVFFVFSLSAFPQEGSSWKTVGYGGGGAMFYPEVSAFDPDFAFVSCDMTGSYVTYNGGKSWRMFNLHSPVDYYVFDPNDENTVYANSIGLFKSTDKGKTWNLFYPSPDEVTGVVSKGDHAQERLIAKDQTLRDVQAFSMAPWDSKEMYAAISIDKKVALYTSEDGGSSWNKKYDLHQPAKNIFINPADKSVVITHNGGVSAVKNDKIVYHKSPKEVNQLTHYTAGYDKVQKKFVIYAIAGKSYFDPNGTASGIYYSEDGGASWQNRERGLTAYNEGSQSPEWRTIATSSNNPSVVYVSYRNIRTNDDVSFIGVAKSADFGKTWTLVWKDSIKKSGNVPSVNFEKEWINERFGPTWGENPFSIGVSPVNPDILYATDFGRTVKTSDGGVTWQQVYTNETENGWTSRGLEVTTGYQIVNDPFDKNRFYMCNTDIGLMASEDGGKSWRSVTHNNGVPRKWQNSTYWLAPDPDVKGKLWAAMTDVHDLPRPKMFRVRGVKNYRGGIMISEDSGKSWKEMSVGIGEGAMTHVLLDPKSDKSARTLYACAFGKGVYKSIDGGKTWVQKNKGIDGSEPFAWRITRRKTDGVLFLVVNRRSEDGSIGNAEDGALYRSDDDAESWKKIALPSGTNGPMSLMANDGRLILSAWGRSTPGKFTPDTGGGIFISKDDGTSWTNVLHRDQHIHDITYDPRNGVYYACGFNGSAYRSEDRGETWKRIKGYNFKWGKRVDPDPSDPEKVYVITFGGGLWHGPAKGDESSAEDIVTPVLEYIP
ncbi:MAG: hypothetical protein JNK79_20500 [Chitinophagaceae bacterium]|nr:hypothetical protein [Chitinophagaceae bacterium]